MSIWIAAAATLAAQVGTLPSPEEAGKAAVRACLAPQDAARPMDSFTSAQRYALLACSQRVAAAMLSERLPIEIDEATTLSAVTASGMDLTYEYRVSVDRSAFGGAYDANVAQSVCADPGMAGVISAGGAYHYIWRDRSRRVLHRLTIDACGDAARPVPIA